MLVKIRDDLAKAMGRPNIRPAYMELYENITENSDLFTELKKSVQSFGEKASNVLNILEQKRQQTNFDELENLYKTSFVDGYRITDDKKIELRNDLQGIINNIKKKNQKRKLQDVLGSMEQDIENNFVSEENKSTIFNIFFKTDPERRKWQNYFDDIKKQNFLGFFRLYEEFSKVTGSMCDYAVTSINLIDYLNLLVLGQNSQCIIMRLKSGVQLVDLTQAEQKKVHDQLIEFQKSSEKRMAVRQILTDINLTIKELARTTGKDIKLNMDLRNALEHLHPLFDVIGAKKNDYNVFLECIYNLCNVRKEIEEKFLAPGMAI